MTSLAVRVGLVLAIGCTAAAAAAPADPYKITAKEKAACTTDAMRLCSHTYPDSGLLLQCMKENRSALSTICLAAFDAGVKRRHLD